MPSETPGQESNSQNAAIRAHRPCIALALTPALWACRAPEGVASAILIGAQIVFHGPEEVTRQLLPALVAALVPWAMTHHHSIRALSQLVLQVRFILKWWITTVEQI